MELHETIEFSHLFCGLFRRFKVFNPKQHFNLHVMVCIRHTWVKNNPKTRLRLIDLEENSEFNRKPHEILDFFHLCWYEMKSTKICWSSSLELKLFQGIQRAFDIQYETIEFFTYFVIWWSRLRFIEIIRRSKRLWGLAWYLILGLNLESGSTKGLLDHILKKPQHT